METLKFNPVLKDRLFYDRFEYCISFNLDEANCMRVLDHAHIDDMLERRQQWREIAQQRWNNGRTKQSTILTRRWREITETTKKDLHTVATALLATVNEYKLVTSIHQAWVYSNDLDLMHRLGALAELRSKWFTQAKISRPKNTIQLKNPRHALRTYLRLCRITDQQKTHLEQFLQSQKSHVRLSPALCQWLDLPYSRVQDYFFVDHDSQAWITMLNLVVPGLVRKTMHIIPAK